jgi:hypothetical protein
MKNFSRYAIPVSIGAGVLAVWYLLKNKQPIVYNVAGTSQSGVPQYVSPTSKFALTRPVLAPSPASGSPSFNGGYDFSVHGGDTQVDNSLHYQGAQSGDIINEPRLNYNVGPANRFDYSTGPVFNFGAAGGNRRNSIDGETINLNAGGQSGQGGGCGCGGGCGGSCSDCRSTCSIANSGFVDGRGGCLVSNKNQLFKKTTQQDWNDYGDRILEAAQIDPFILASRYMGGVSDTVEAGAILN